MSVYPATNSNEAVELIIEGGNQLHDIINEAADKTVTTESGEIPSVRKAIADSLMFLEPLPWKQGESETNFLQIRSFGSELYWSPSATVSTPKPMGVSPVGDSNWKLAPLRLSKSSILSALGKINKGFWDENPKLENKEDFVVERNTGNVFGAITLPYQVDNVTYPDPNTLVGTDLIDISNFINQEQLNESFDKSLKSTGISFETVSDMKSGTLQTGESIDLSKFVGARVEVSKYYSDREGGGTCGTVKSGSHTDDGGSIFSIDTDTYVEVTDYNALLDPLSWGIKAGAGQDDLPFWNNLIAWYESKTVVLTPAGGSRIYTAPRLKSLRGVSQLSDTLKLPSYFLADFGSLIFKRHSSWSAPIGRFLIEAEQFYQADFGGLTIENENYTIRLKNSNLDKTKLKFSGVTLTSCDNAIETECQSTILNIEDFRSDNCKRFLTVKRGDMVILDKGWITQGALTDKWGSTIRNENAQLIIKKVIGVPMPHTGEEVAWINNTDGRVIIENFRAGAEDGSCALVNNFARFRTEDDDDSAPRGVKVYNSENYSVDTQGGKQKSCIIRLFNLPNFVEYYDNRGHALTEEVITWGSTAVDQQSQIYALTSQLKNFSYRYDHNLEQGAINTYPNNLSGLFGPDSHFTLYPKLGTSGEVNCDTRLKPRTGQIYELVIKANPSGGGNSNFASVWMGKVLVATGNNSGTPSRNLLLVEDAKSAGGATFSNNLSVAVKYFDGSSESDFAAVTNNNFRIRVKVSGFQAGYEGSAFTGYIRKLL